MKGDLLRNVTDSADITAVSQLVLREREARDLCKWETMRDELNPAIPGQSVSIDPDEVEGPGSSCRNLSWCLRQNGYDVDHNLPGEDRPETVDRILKEVGFWLEETRLTD